jgi:predicted MFS family arabinose efflux permease
MSPTARLSLAGFLATAVAFGPARMGYGLFLPDFRESFGLTTGTAGVIASAAFGSFLGGLLLAARLTARRGPRAPVVAGALAAAFGTALVALAGGPALLAAGVVLAGASSGLCWSPFNAAAERCVPKTGRARVLSVVSSGTTVGIAGTGLLALALVLTEAHWRATWAAFAACALAAAAVNLQALPRGPGSGPAAARRGRLGRALRLAGGRLRPLVLAAVSFGLTSGVYLSFAVDRVAGAAAPSDRPAVAGPMLFVAFGLGGLAGFLAGDIDARTGTARLLRVVFLCSAVSLGLVGAAPGEAAAAGLSAALQGACLMLISAIFSFASLRIRPAQPSAAFTAVLLAFASGNLLGPALAGAAGEAVGLGAAFGAAAALSLATALALPRSAGRPAEPA